MKTHLLIALFLTATLQAADLPTVTVEHLYYLQARGERIRKLKPDEMIDYCIAQKIGGASFEHLYAQVFTMRIDLVKLLKIEEVQPNDPRVTLLKKTQEAYASLLREEAGHVQAGIVREGVVATDTMNTIARAQNTQ